MKTKKKKINYNLNLFSYIVFGFLAIYTLIILGTLLWAFIASFKDYYWDFSSNPFGLPQKIVFDNYTAAFTKLYVPVGTKLVYMPQMFLNSLLISFGTVIPSLISHMSVAYVCSRYRFKFSKVVYGIVVVTMFIPTVGTLPSALKILRALNFYDNFFGFCIMNFSFRGTAFLIFYACFSSISFAYTEAAKIDGAGNLYIMVMIIFPLAVPTAIGMGLLTFISAWNSYTAQMLYLPSMPSLAYGLYLFQNFRSAGGATLPTMKLAASFIVCVPIIILFMIFKEKLMGNLTLGGIKG